jgi:hypothetical protein
MKVELISFCDDENSTFSSSKVTFLYKFSSLAFATLTAHTGFGL